MANAQSQALKLKPAQGGVCYTASMHSNPILNENGEVEKAGCVVLNDKNEILLVTTAERSAWGLPKGHAEAGENPQETALRETLEETGYEVEIIGPFGDLTYKSERTKLPVRVRFFLAKPLARYDQAEEEWAWVELSKAVTLVQPNVAAFLEKYLLQKSQ